MVEAEDRFTNGEENKQVTSQESLTVAPDENVVPFHNR